MATSEDKIAALTRVLEKHLADNTTISYNSVQRASDGVFKSVSDLTRIPSRRTLIERYQEKQAEVRKVAEALDVRSLEASKARNAKNEIEIASLKEQRILLIASHRAAIMALTTLGGFKAWERFFDETSKQGLYETLSASEQQDVRSQNFPWQPRRDD